MEQGILQKRSRGFDFPEKGQGAAAGRGRQPVLPDQPRIDGEEERVIGEPGVRLHVVDSDTERLPFAAQLACDPGQSYLGNGEGVCATAL